MHSPDQNSTDGTADHVAHSSENFYAALSEIGQLLVRSLDPQVLYEAVIEVLERRLGAMLVMLGEVDHASGMFCRTAPATVPAGKQDIYPDRLPLSVAQLPFWQGTPQLEADIRQLPGSDAARQAYLRHGVVAVVAVPVMKFGEVCAGLLIRAGHAGFFSPRMIELLQQAAASIGLDMEAREQRLLLLRAARKEARQRRVLRLLSEMIKVVTHSDSEPALLADTCDVAHRVGGYRFAWIGMLDRDAPGILRLCASAGMAATAQLDERFSLSDPARAGDAVVNALATGQPSICHLRPGAPRDWPLEDTELDLDAVLALPLRVEGVIVGALVVGATQPEAFTSVETQVFQEIGVELGLGMQVQRAQAARLVAEHELRFNLEHFHTILSNQYSGLLVVSEHDTVRFANDAFCKLYGFSEAPAELEGRSSQVIYARIAQVYRDPQKERARLKEIIGLNVPVRGDEVAMADGRIFLRDFTPIRIDGILRGRIWQQRDITEQKAHEARVEHLAFYDVVTGLPNRRLLFNLLEQARADAGERGALLAVGILDLDRFKSVNDTIGHEGGDQVLVEASSRILGMLREADVLARFGGDEFALLIPGLDGPEQLDVIGRCILQALRAPFSLMSEQLYLSASIGWTLYPLDNADAEGLVRHADMAMYAAKEEGKDRGLLYEPAMEAESQRLQAMRERMAQALLHDHLKLAFQPIVYIDGLPGVQGVAGMEALLRLNDSGQELVAPGSFMHVLDDPQLARPIGRFVLGEALRQCQEWLRVGISIPVSVNISTRHLLHPAFFSDIDAALENYPDVMDVGFGIEVTETGPSMDHARAKIVIEECRHRGIRVGLDDFGTGSASLSHIQQLDIEHIKLDQSFVRDILGDERNMAIAAGVITTARMLAKIVIAEGVETAEQGDLLASLGCHQLQGFSISRPMPGELVPAWVARWAPPSSWTSLANERQSLLVRHADGA
ncbi:MAG: EAL domain-containing protein [Xanthomonadaceae bacterium]|jgi:diguanylate cyclase (GGDEF)-like protein/PAS domain S-box-containing protein|nr:EAL domain-containing protein [Xanthomonadaceae bacterium]